MKKGTLVSVAFRISCESSSSNLDLIYRLLTIPAFSHERGSGLGIVLRRRARGTAKIKNALHGTEGKEGPGEKGTGKYYELLREKVMCIWSREGMEHK